MEMFEERVRAYPEHTAVIDGVDHYTYAQLNRRANRLALRLCELSVGSDKIVAIMAERSYEMIAGIFGVLKAGGAYLPIDVNCPENRKRQILADSGTGLLLTGTGYRIDGVNTLSLSDESDCHTDGDNPERLGGVHDLAYVIYTSGSTGKPKGVMIEHSALANRLGWMQEAYPIGPGDVILQKTVCTFDVSVWEILWWSAQGAAVCVMPPKKEASVKQLVRVIEENRVSVMHFVPSVLRIFLDYIETGFDLGRLKSLRYVFSSGEALSPDLVNRFNRLFSEETLALLVNLYGPTEAAIDVTHFPCAKGVEYTEIPIGRAIHNTYFLILDEKLRMVGQGQTGDLYIGGANLARGYLGRPELTTQVFIQNPYARGERIYKSGDTAFCRADGLICYQGRIDDQVKLRGIRIELKEIEYHLLRCKGVKNAIAAVRTDGDGNQVLCAYIVSEEWDEALSSRVKSYLADNLPSYMIPSRFFLVSAIPLKTNGKVDRVLLERMCSGR
jgi:amino acid adenylation domain-containing protein